MPRVSVIIPTYNCAGLLPRAVASVLRQTMQDFEIVIVDDGSTDDTSSVVASYREDPRIRCVAQENRGLPGARNAGIAVASAAYIAALDADDELAPNALEVLAAALDAHPDAGWCVMDILRIDGAERRTFRSRIPADLFYGILEDDFIRRGMFFRATALAAVGGYDATVREREDWELNIRLIHAGIRFVHVPRALYWYHWRADSITTARPHRKLGFTEMLLRMHHKRLADAGDRRAAAIYAECMWDLARRQLHGTRRLLPAAACVRESLAYGIGIRRLFRPLRGWLRTAAAPAATSEGGR